MKNSLVLFDFDGTITSRDTLFEFIKYNRGTWSLVCGLVRLSPMLVLHLFKIVSATSAKEALLTYYFKGMLLEEFDKLCFSFTEQRLSKLLNLNAVKKIDWHKENGHRVVIVTASPENWVQHWCSKMQIELVGTKLEIEQNRLTGRLKSKNCNGPEKVARIRELLEVEFYEQVYAYGNSRGDKEMLELAHHRFYKNF